MEYVLDELLVQPLQLRILVPGYHSRLGPDRILQRVPRGVLFMSSYVIYLACFACTTGSPETSFCMFNYMCVWSALARAPFGPV